MLVYVLNKDGHPLMPTERCGKVRRMLKSGLAKVIKRCPFTIQLIYETTNIVQEVNLGIDAGSKTIGLSATTESKELFASNVTLRNDIVDLLSTRRANRRTRRNRKTRYRKARFDNRAIPKGWLAPSIQNKINTHLKVVADVYKLLPIKNIIVETASFDIQKIKNPEIQGVEYQQGEQLNFWNVREYVLFRDNHTCQCCKGKFKDKILNVHHIESRKTGGNAPNNLITLCEYCHKQYHLDNIKLPKTVKRGASFKDAAFMGIMRWAFYEQLKAMYPCVTMTFGYITKNIRITNNLPKEHYVDARCISKNQLAKPLGYYYLQKKVRCHNRQIHKMTIGKGGYRKLNQAPFIVKGFRLFDKVKYKNTECFILARRTRGSFCIGLLDGTKINTDITCKKLTMISCRKNILIERKSSAILNSSGI